MDSKQFSALCIPYSRKLYAIAFRIVRRAVEAEDVVQEVLLRAWQIREQFVDATSIEARLVTMTKNLAIDMLRTRHTVEDESIDTAPPPDEPDTSDEEQLEQRDQLRHTLHLIRQLPEVQQTILQLRLMKELDFADIARITGLSEGNVRVQLTRARQQLKLLATKHHIL